MSFLICLKLEAFYNFVIDVVNELHYNNFPQMTAPKMYEQTQYTQIYSVYLFLQKSVVCKIFTLLSKDYKSYIIYQIIDYIDL